MIRPPHPGQRGFASSPARFAARFMRFLLKPITPTPVLLLRLLYRFQPLYQFELFFGFEFDRYGSYKVVEELPRHGGVGPVRPALQHVTRQIGEALLDVLKLLGGLALARLASGPLAIRRAGRIVQPTKVIRTFSGPCATGAIA